MYNRIVIFIIGVVVLLSLQFCSEDSSYLSDLDGEEVEQGQNGLEISPKIILANDGKPRDFFGVNVDMQHIGNKDWAIIGASRADGARGAAYVFEASTVGNNENSGPLVQTAKLTVDGAQRSSYVGTSVALGGRHPNILAAVGAHGFDNDGVRSGAAFIFGRNAGGANNWGLMKKLTPYDGEKSDYFGSSIAISEDTIVVGAYGHDYAGWQAGAIYIFSENKGGMGNWGLEKKITTRIIRDGDNFGREIALEQDTLIVGAPNKGDIGTLAGAVFVFERNRGGHNNWGLLQILWPSDGVKKDLFGSAVDIDAGRIVVGASMKNAAEISSGAVYTFVKPDGSDYWMEESKITPPIETLTGRFGQGVSLFGSKLAVGEYGNSTYGRASGAVYIYDVQFEQPILLQQIIPADGEAEDRFGLSVGITSTRVLGGSAWNDDLGEDSGAAYEARF